MKILNHSALLGIALLIMGFAFFGCDQPSEVTPATSKVTIPTMNAAANAQRAKPPTTVAANASKKNPKVWPREQVL